MDMAQLPEPMQRLGRVLEAAGYRLSADVYDEKAFGNRYADLTRDGFTVRFVLDRGQWRLDLGGPGRDGPSRADWSSPPVWKEYLSGEPSGDSLPTLGEQCAFVANELSRIERAFAGEENIRQRLHNVGVDQYQRRQRQRFDRASHGGWVSGCEPCGQGRNAR